MSPGEIRTSGLLELYVFGNLEEDEFALVNEALKKYPELHDDLDAIERSLLDYAETTTPKPSPAIKAFLVATVDYTDRLQKGEQPGFVPMLDENSRIEDFGKWLDNPAMSAPDDYEVVYTKVISFEPEKSTALVWLRYGAPDETHTNEYEKFLIVEGTCDITVGSEVHHLHPGDYLEIPLFVNHNVRVTSETPCKVILQRVAV